MDWSVFWSTAIGATFGTSAAFLVQWLKQERDRVQEEVRGGNQALLVLSLQLQEVYRLWGQGLKSVEQLPDRHLRLKRYEGTPMDAELAVRDLVFLARAPNPLPGLVRLAFEAQMAATSCRRSLETRNNYHRRLLEDSETELKALPVASPDEFVAGFARVIGPIREAQLKSHTDNLYEQVAEAKELMRGTLSDLRRALADRYPGFEFVETHLE